MVTQNLGTYGQSRQGEIYTSISSAREASLPKYLLKYFGCIMLINSRWVEWILGKQNICLNPKYNSLRELCVDILKAFSAATLRHTATGKILTSAALYKPLEAAYQDEFYRCFNVVAGRGFRSVRNGQGQKMVESIFGFQKRSGQLNF